MLAALAQGLVSLGEAHEAIELIERCRADHGAGAARCSAQP